MYPPQGVNLHQWLIKNDMAIYSPLVDLMGNYQIGQKTVLYMLDALIWAPSEGASVTSENSTWKQEPFNGDYTSSIFYRACRMKEMLWLLLKIKDPGEEEAALKRWLWWASHGRIDAFENLYLILFDMGLSVCKPFEDQFVTVAAII